MPQSKFWVQTVQTQFRLRLTGAEADDFKAALNLPEDFESPLEWWANLGEKEQLIASPQFDPPADAEEALTSASLERYQTGMVMTLRREKGNRVVIQLPKQAFRLGVIPDVRARIVVYARAGSLEFWKTEAWKEEATQAAVSLRAHRERAGD